MENTPCETQAPITDLSANTSAPMQQINTSPTSSLPLPLQKAQTSQALSVVERAAHADGLKVNLPKGMKP
jgi:hypothetical protein